MARSNLNSKSLLISLLALLVAIGCTTTEQHLNSQKNASQSGLQKNALVTQRNV